MLSETTLHMHFLIVADITCISKLMWPSCSNEVVSCTLVNFDSCWNLFLSLPYNEDALHMMYWSILCCREQKNLKTHKRFLKCKILEEESITPLKVYKDFAHISYDDASFLILENFR